MSASTPQRLATMANQIAANLAREPDPVAATADHIASFWSLAMQRQLAGAADVTLSGTARAAIERLVEGDTPPPQTRATDPALHGSDAG